MLIPPVMTISGTVAFELKMAAQIGQSGSPFPNLTWDPPKPEFEVMFSLGSAIQESYATIKLHYDMTACERSIQKTLKRVQRRRIHCLEAYASASKR